MRVFKKSTWKIFIYIRKIYFSVAKLTKNEEFYFCFTTFVYLYTVYSSCKNISKQIKLFTKLSRDCDCVVHHKVLIFQGIIYFVSVRLGVSYKVNSISLNLTLNRKFINFLCLFKILIEKQHKKYKFKFSKTQWPNRKTIQP